MGELRSREGLAVRADPLEQALGVAQTLPGVEKAWVEDDVLRILTNPGGAAEINAALVRAGLRVSELRTVEQSLEEVFLRLTAGRDARADTEADDLVP